MTAVLLPIPDDPIFQRWIDAWNEGKFSIYPHPRSVWLGTFERQLAQFYPQANSASLKLTARHHAPFFLAAGHDVP